MGSVKKPFFDLRSMLAPDRTLAEDKYALTDGHYFYLLMTDYESRSVDAHLATRGKWEIAAKFPLETKDDLSIAYSPGVAGVCRAISNGTHDARDVTFKGNTVAIISDGTAVLGLGNIGPEASLPVMEGKAVLFKRFAGIDGVPIVVNSNSAEEFIQVVRAIAPTFGGINLEDIAAPDCFKIEEALQDIGIPVFHDDQHGTAIVLTAALINAAKVIGKSVFGLKVVIVGAGAAGTAIAQLLKCRGDDTGSCTAVREILICDSKGIISPDRNDLNLYKRQLLAFTNSSRQSGTLEDALIGADVFVGVSKGGLLNEDHIRSMAPDAIVFGMANPDPEIMPDIARAAGAAVVGTGRSDLPNQVNNVLAFPGIFRGALDAGAERITNAMKQAAVLALANATTDLSAEKILPDPFDPAVPEMIAKAVFDAAKGNS